MSQERIQRGPSPAISAASLLSPMHSPALEPYDTYTSDPPTTPSPASTFSAVFDTPVNRYESSSFKSVVDTPSTRYNSPISTNEREGRKNKTRAPAGDYEAIGIYSPASEKPNTLELPTFHNYRTSSSPSRSPTPYRNRVTSKTPLYGAAAERCTQHVLLLRKLARPRVLLWLVALFTLSTTLIISTKDLQATSELYNVAKVPLQNSVDVAKAWIGSGKEYAAGLLGSDDGESSGKSLADIFSFGSDDLLSINTWGSLTAGRDSIDGLLPLSPWKRFKSNWRVVKEDKDLQHLRLLREDGRLLVREGKPHPIPLLMKRAKRRWEQLRQRQSKTFVQAVREYQRRYGRHPPKGFDRWYAFAKAHNVKMIDEFDLIEHSLRPFRAFSPESFRLRAEKAAELEAGWSIRVEKGRLYRGGELGHHERAQGIIKMCERFKTELPNMLIGYNGHDGARVNLGWEERMRLEDLVEDNKHEQLDRKGDPKMELKPVMPSPPPGWGIPQTCEPSSAMRRNGFDFGDARRDVTGYENPAIPDGAIGTLVDNFKGYMDTCNSPQYRHFHSSTSWAFQTWPTPVMPLFTPGVHARFADVYCIITEQFDNEVAEDLPWDQRQDTRLVWRGQASGPYYEATTPWQSTQRPRLHLLSHERGGKKAIVMADKRGNAKREMYSMDQLNPAFFNTGLTGPPRQCNEEDGTCDKMHKVFDGFDGYLTFEQQNQYKYLLDIDGNSWSGRFRRLMLSNGVVLKATIFQEFWTDWAVPWLHFIPLQVDYSDLWDTLAFFRGGPNGENAHDDMAKEIAKAGADWAREHLRWEDIEAYTFRQLLEYGRLYNADREDMDFRLEVEDYEPIWYEHHVKT